MFRLNEKILKYYNHENFEELLDYDFISKLKKLSEINDIQICGFNVETSGIYPFIRFLLNKENEEFSFIKIEKKELIKKSLDEAINICIEKIELIMNVEKVEEVEKLLEYNYVGSYYYEKKIYIFIKIFIKQDEFIDISKQMCLMDEIINLRSNCNIKINNDVAEFFISNISMFLLYDEENKPIEIPSVMYLWRENRPIQFTSSIEMGKGDACSMFGPHYYFTNYRNVVKELKNENKEIIRYAIFIGKQLVKLNYPEDPIDISRVKKEKLLEIEDVRKYEVLTMRLTDYDGLWSNYYDSIYIGNLKLDDDSKMKKNHICAVKDKNRCVLLSCHNIK